jgi:prepilin peptidase CpaA
MLEVIILLLFPLAMFYAAASDMFSMTISNKVSLVLVAGFIVLSWAIGMDLQAIAWHWALAAVVLVCGIGFFAIGLMGGGDVKLAAATSLWLGWEHTLPYLVMASFMGGVLTILIILARAWSLPVYLLKIQWIARLHDKDKGVPYGIALGPAAVMVYPDTPWMQYVFNSIT